VLKQVQPVLAFAESHLDEDLSLQALAGHAGLSPFHLHRVFSAAAGETPKQFTSRLRLDHAAAMLLTTKDSVLNVALSCGFQSHETFCRAFHKRFETTPSAYRARGFAGGTDRAGAGQHAALVSSVGPCLRLVRIQGDGRSETNDMPYSITKKKIAAQPVLVVRRRVKPSEIAATLAEVLGHVFLHAQRDGIALAGQPLTRYLEWGPGLLTIEAGFPVAAHPIDAPSAADVRADTLPGGFVATATHAGSYDKLADAHAAIQQWIEAEGLTAAGAPWECYVTDPADYPDPQDWKTEVFWPLG
jgi:AraC family transcriptional regulator